MKIIVEHVFIQKSLKKFKKNYTKAFLSNNSLPKIRL